MTPSERRIAAALGRGTFLPASWDKRFARQMAFHAEHQPEKPLTDRQSAHLLRLCHKYRQQIPTRIIEECLDEMERQAKRRVERGEAALPDFNSRRRALVREQPPRRKEPAPLPLFDGGVP